MDPLLKSTYDYTLPPELIATHPVEPRDEARLLVFDRKSGVITHTLFKHLFDFLPADVAVLLNDTKVVKARIFGKKESGGEVEVLLNAPLQENLYSVYIRGRVKVGTKLFFDEKMEAEIRELKEDGTRIVAFSQEGKPLHTKALFDVLEKIGHIPLPPYIKREDTDDDSVDYQTVFAKEQGAVAAPTASLHFTDTMFEVLKKRYETHFLTLHVGAGTFKPVEAEHIKDHIMHSEIYTIPSLTCKLIESPKNILAVGTTVTRTVEYFARTKVPVGKCDLFLHPQNCPIRVNHLLTNFHLPKSTLIMLVASFVGIEKTLELYEEAVKEKYRFFSYGDAMLII
ncbi:tRNA preQ1(34) S-adenosylmethionine ribosyltransferase-isomerase QueA [Sulfurospirillum oryzae]|uniref:tRNA preQ1(34) S-adenosylmethionine ribosyltransferase-isomerase QueA n=1 Tax=Sulfurospirillum oryzae TaxID=2976535 RepID=UPI0021E897FE|nr:tRNA preQ1(34) S-adenosylmethionine ribosyltransferase-isomerase QueA [Sulfurospirillum oryzae]